MALTKLTTKSITGDTLEAGDLAANSVDSSELVDGSIDTSHIGALQVTEAKIAADAVTLAKMASGTDGNIISYDASGNPVAIATGSDGQVLTSAGAGQPPAFEAVSAGVSLSGSTNNTVATVTGANALIGEANLLFDGTNLGVGGTPVADRKVKIFGTSSNRALVVAHSGNEWAFTTYVANNTSDDGQVRLGCTGNDALIYAGGSERVRVNSSGNFLVGKTSTTFSTAGTELYYNGDTRFTAANNAVIKANRTGGDGEIFSIYNDGSLSGTISFSGGTVSYNTFCGSHWSRLADNSKPTILRGTVMESIATMCDWYEAVADVEETTDEDGNVTPAHKVKQMISLPDGKSVGDAVTFTSDEKEYTGVYVKEDNQQLPMSKISDTEDSKAVYGVFMDWDDKDDGLNGDVNDMNVASLGAFVVRVHSGETVAIGDYLQSKGDGTAKVQADDILRASTIAKVTSTEKTITHEDGSYCVPCTLHCG